MTDEQIVTIVAETIERSMFAPHEFPLSLELHAKYLTTARAVIKELKFARPKLVESDDTKNLCPAGREMCQAHIAHALAHAVTKERERCIQVIAPYQSARAGIAVARSPGAVIAEIERRIRDGYTP